MAVVISSAAGCSTTAGAYPVKGKVVRTDGKPVTSGQIEFRGENASASGPIQPDGSFTLGSNVPGDGALPGKYKVYLSGDCLGSGYDGKPAEVDAKYGDADKSGLEFEVKAQTNTFEIKVDPPAGAATGG